MKNDKNEYSSNSILLWIAENFTPIDKIEQASTGVLYCEIINRIYPNSINMNKLNYGKSLSYDQILKNYKILQDAFKKNKIDKNFETNKLMKGRFQDNLEFLQWFRNHYNKQNPSNSNYPIFNFSDNISVSSIESKSTISNNLKKINSARNLNIKCSFLEINKASKKADELEYKEDGLFSNNLKSDIKKNQASNLKSMRKRKEEEYHLNYSSIMQEYENIALKYENENKEIKSSLQKTTNELDTLKANNNDLKKVIGIIQKERDFYYSKLRDIEILLNNDKLNKSLVDKILTSDNELEVVFNSNNTPELKIIK
jgi:RP/EB family microtubule-associated protein